MRGEGLEENRLVPGRERSHGMGRGGGTGGVRG